MEVHHELPDDIIYNILLRIPAEILVTSKAVCKPWCNLISDDHEFIYAHLNHHRGDFKQIIVLNTKEREYELSHLQEKVQAATITNNFQLHHHQLQIFLKDDIQFCSSCEGLILYQSMHKQKHQLYLCNPVTYKCKTLQSPLLETVGSSIELWQWALIYDASLRKYKVFGLLATSHTCYVFTPQSYHSNGGHVLGDTTDTDVIPTQWRELVICAPWPKSCRLSKLTLLSKELHWLLASWHGPEVTLCSLDVFKEELREIELPFLTRLSCSWGKNSIIEVLGKLSITDYHHEHDQLDIWSLQDREKGLWTN